MQVSPKLRKQLIAGFIGVSIASYGLYHFLFKKRNKKVKFADDIKQVSEENTLQALSKVLDFEIKINGGIYTQETVHKLVRAIFAFSHRKFQNIYENYTSARREVFESFTKYTKCFNVFMYNLHKIIEETSEDIFFKKDVNKDLWKKSLMVYDHIGEDKEIKLFANNIFEFLRRDLKSKNELLVSDIITPYKQTVEYIEKSIEDTEEVKNWLSQLKDQLLLKVLFKIRALDYLFKSFSIEEEDFLNVLQAPEAFKNADLQFLLAEFDQILHKLDIKRRNLSLNI